MKRMIRGAILPLAVCLFLQACSPATPDASAEVPIGSAAAPASAPSQSVANVDAANADSAAPDAADLTAYVRRITQAKDVDCPGNASPCKADGVEINAGDCGDPGYGAVMETGGLTLQDRLEASNAQPVARLAEGQLVCIAATAALRDGSQPIGREYLVAVPAASVPECKSSSLCKGKDHPVEWLGGKAPGVTCSRGGASAGTGYNEGCAAGWVDYDSGSIDRYSMGIAE